MTYLDPLIHLGNESRKLIGSEDRCTVSDGGSLVVKSESEGSDDAERSSSSYKTSELSDHSSYIALTGGKGS